MRAVLSASSRATPLSSEVAHPLTASCVSPPPAHLHLIHADGSVGAVGHVGPRATARISALERELGRWWHRKFYLFNHVIIVVVGP